MVSVSLKPLTLGMFTPQCGNNYVRRVPIIDSSEYKECHAHAKCDCFDYEDVFDPPSSKESDDRQRRHSIVYLFDSV